MSRSEHVQARAFGELLLRGKVDKAGDALFAHAERIAARMPTHHHAAVSYLHDVVEDSQANLDDLRVFFSEDVVAAVGLLTRDFSADATYADYIQRLAQGDTVARDVKLADLLDHLDRREYISASLVRRYEKAVAVLADSIAPADAARPGDAAERTLRIRLLRDTEGVFALFVAAPIEQHGADCEEYQACYGTGGVRTRVPQRHAERCELADPVECEGLLAELRRIYAYSDISIRIETAGLDELPGNDVDAPSP